ncbi:GntR family transcriptional regulator [Lacticaseibacillus porcinae]|uniref:GntR family transcriptional regulator n=1 Tax=Lacticaseibacillus porcinae TaxID=1123687 RepID=UPI000F7830D8|nr:GntR family transcriptional regulator [Lacticaseibacillus porcinae]
MTKPKHQQIQAELLARIQNGTYPEGSVIPKELDLADSFQVSRPTVRQAIEALVNAGYLERKRRVGTRVRQTKLAQEFTHVIRNFDSEMAQNGVIAKTAVLYFHEEAANEEVQQALKLDADAKVYKLLRLRFADDQPVVLVTTYLTRAGLDDFDQIDFTKASLYEELAKRDCAITHVERKLEVMSADETTASLLNVDTGAPIFYFHTYGQTKDHQSLEYSIAKYRGDNNYFTISLDR